MVISLHQTSCNWLLKEKNEEILLSLTCMTKAPYNQRQIQKAALQQKKP